MSVNDEDLRPKQWQKFDIEGIMHKEFVPPGQAVNGKFCCDVLKWLRDNIWRMCPDKWRNNSRVRNHDSVEAHVLLVVQQCFGFYEYELSPTLPTHRTLPPCDFFLFPKNEIENQGATFDRIEAIQTELQNVRKTLMQNVFHKCFQSWSPTGISVSVPKGLVQRGWGRIEISVVG